MIKIDIAAAGRLKEPYWEAACAEYAKRLGRYCKLTVAESAETTFPPVSPSAFLVALCVEGERLSSQAFAQKLGAWQLSGVSRLCFAVGGSNGLPESVLRAADFKLSLSDMTWPHHMARAMLLEQIYRAFTILGGGKYHK